MESASRRWSIKAVELTESYGIHGNTSFGSFLFPCLFIHEKPPFPIISLLHPDRLITSTASSLAVLCVLALAAWPALNPKMKAGRLFRSLNFHWNLASEATATCEDSLCFQVFGVVNLFDVPSQVTSMLTRQVLRAANRWFEACMLIFTHSCVLSVVVVVSTIMVIIVLSFFITVVMISETVSLDVMSKCIVESFCFLRSWDGKLVSSKSLHLFTSSVHAWKIFAFLYHVFKFLYRSIHGVLIQGYAVDYSLHMVTLSAQLRKQCHHISMFGKWMLDIALVILFFWASQPLSKYSYYCILYTLLLWFSFDSVVPTLSLLCEDTPAKPQSLRWWRRICSM